MDVNEFVVLQFDEEKENRTQGEGADCNRIIMFLTDGGTEMPEELFKKYNWPLKKVGVSREQTRHIDVRHGAAKNGSS